MKNLISIRIVVKIILTLSVLSLEVILAYVFSKYVLTPLGENNFVFVGVIFAIIFLVVIFWINEILFQIKKILSKSKSVVKETRYSPRKIEQNPFEEDRKNHFLGSDIGNGMI